MKNILNQRGALVFEIVVGILVLVVAGVVGYSVLQNRQVDKPSEVQTPVKKDPYAGWQTFTSKVNGLTFKYPPKWEESIEYKQVASEFNLEEGEIKSPEGFILTLRNPPDGLGGGCPDPCPIVTETFSATPKNITKGKNIYLVKQRVYDSTNNDPGEKRIGLYEETEPEYYTIKTTKYQGFPPYLIFHGPEEKDYVWMSGSYPETNPKAKLSLDKYFELDDLKTAELIFNSVKFK